MAQNCSEDDLVDPYNMSTREILLEEKSAIILYKGSSRVVKQKLFKAQSTINVSGLTRCTNKHP